MTHPRHSTHPAQHPGSYSALDLPAATHSYLARAAASLREAMTTPEVPMRYACAHVAALRATAALLAARATPAPAPELAEWASFFAAGAAKRAAAESGSQRAVTEREADDLVRAADRFLGLVEESLGMTRHVPLQENLPCPVRPSPVSRSA
jgi:hypothetical protein